MLDWFQTITDHAGTFIFEGYVFIAHFVASVLSSITKSTSDTGGKISQLVRKGIDYLAFNIGHAEPRTGDHKVELSEVKLENERLRKIVNLHRRDTEQLRDNQYQTDKKHKEMINELKADHRSVMDKLRREAQEYLEKIDKLERELRDNLGRDSSPSKPKRGRPPKKEKTVIKDMPQETMSEVTLHGYVECEDGKLRHLTKLDGHRPKDMDDESKA